jgi:hypothetical protein
VAVARLFVSAWAVTTTFAAARHASSQHDSTKIYRVFSGLYVATFVVQSFMHASSPVANPCSCVNGCQLVRRQHFGNFSETVYAFETILMF